MSSLILYITDDGKSQIQLRAKDQTVWLSQREMAELFDVSTDNVGLHLKNIYEDGELSREATAEESSVVQTEGTRQVQRPVTLYNLDAILAVGYRVRSPRGVQFRRWASTVLKEYLVKGFVLDDERLKNPDGRPDYFDEMLARIRDIRASEKRFYQKVRDLFALAADYDKSDEATQTFFATVQNKVHYAIHGHTAAELIKQRADSSQPNMGLTNWNGARIRKSDVSVAKNYLTEEELRALNNLAEQYLVFAEGQAARRIAMTMQDWVTKLEGFLTLNDREILRGAGRISADLAKNHAEQEFTKFRTLENASLESDFDKMVKCLPAPRKGKQ